MRPLAILFFILLLILPFGLGSFLFVVNETQQAVVLQFGKPIKIVAGHYKEEHDRKLLEYLNDYNRHHSETIEVHKGAGLYFKVPLIQNVRYFEDRLLEYDSAPTAVVTKDKKNLLIDNFARWRIVNPLLFLQSVRTEAGAQARLDDIIYSVLRGQLANNKLIEIVRNSNRPLTTIEAEEHLVEEINTGREQIMATVMQKCNEMASPYGIEVLDVRIKRADLPVENAKAVFGRMEAERNRISTRYRSEGLEESEKIKAQTDRDVKIILAEAYKEAEKMKGDADGRAAAIYAAAYSAHKDFYAFLKSLETLEKTVNSRTKIILGAKESVFKVLLKRK